MHLGWALTALCVGVCVFIAVLLLYALLRRRNSADNDKMPDEDAGVNWVYIGTLVSTIILFGFTIYMLNVLAEISKPSQAPALTITVTGYDWWWKVEYEDADVARRFVTANEIHIPIGKPVQINLNSADVIHAFWVPELAGKTQMIPGQTNQQWIEADKPGAYLGQCTQYCGVQHAHMLFEVIAQENADFEAWENQQRAPALKARDVSGRKIFMQQCSGCHTVRGTEASGEHGPDLTHLGSRRMIAAGLLTNTPEHIIQWTTRAQELKPGARMPSIVLSPAEQADLSTYLATLQ